MFESLSDRLSGVFDRLRGRGALSEADVRAAMREVRVALLEADVALPVVREFIDKATEQAVGQQVLKSVTPGQQVVKIVHDTLVEMLGADETDLALDVTPPAVIMMVGLQGSGKTTTAGKIANLLRKQGRRPLLVAADVHRPAAIDQLEALGRQLSLPVRRVAEATIAADVAAAVREAPGAGQDVVIVDTAGRLHIDEAMMAEVEAIIGAAAPHEILLVVDSMAGQDAVDAASAFKRRLPVTGLVVTKVDSDARGGAALSIRAATGVPVKLMGTSERLDGIEAFHPDRLAQRILGMGDVVSLVERAQEHVDEKEAEASAKRLLEARFTFEDFLTSLRQIRKMGPIGDLMKMIPGMGQLARQMPSGEQAERELTRIEAIISSMTKAERSDPSLLNGSRRKRIAAGSGTTVSEVNAMVKQFGEMQKLMKQLGPMAKAGRLPRLPGMPKL